MRPKPLIAMRILILAPDYFRRVNAGCLCPWRYLSDPRLAEKQNWPAPRRDHGDSAASGRSWRVMLAPSVGESRRKINAETTVKAPRARNAWWMPRTSAGAL